MARNPNGREDRLADQLHSAAIHLLRRLRRVDEQTGLSGPKLSALSVIVFRGPISLGKLAAAEQVRPPSMTAVVRDLENQGFVERHPDQHDRRISLIQATKKGKDVLRLGRNRRVILLADWMRSLAKDEIVILESATEILERLLAELE